MSALLLLYLFPIKTSIQERQLKLRPCIQVTLFLGVLKVAHDYSYLFIKNKEYEGGDDGNINLYSLLGIHRMSSHLDIVQAYKRFSPAALNDSIKFAYNCLIDEKSRAIYNKFGFEVAKSGLDPIADELLLLTAFVKLIFVWTSLLYVYTLHPGSKGARVWICVFFSFLIYIQFSFTVINNEMPVFITSLVATMTEHELIMLLHSIFPVIATFLVGLSQVHCINVEQVVTEILENWRDEQKLQMAYLQSLQVALVTLTTAGKSSELQQEEQKNKDQLEIQIANVIESLKTNISSEKRLNLIKSLNDSEDSIGGKYLRWLSIAFFIYMHFL